MAGDSRAAAAQTPRHAHYRERLSHIHTQLCVHSAGQSAQLTDRHRQHTGLSHRNSAEWIWLTESDFLFCVVVFASVPLFHFCLMLQSTDWIYYQEEACNYSLLKPPGLGGNDKRETGDNAGLHVALGPTTSSRSPATRGCSLRWDSDDVRLRFSGVPGWDYQSIGANPEYQNEICCCHRTDPGWRSEQPGYCWNGAESGK